MSEAPVYKEHGAVFGKDEIGLARQASVEAVAQAERVQGTADDHFRTRVLPADRCHVLAANRPAVDVGHG